MSDDVYYLLGCCTVIVLGLCVMVMCPSCIDREDAARSNAWALERARMAVEAYAPDARERVIALWKAAAAESPRSFANQEDSTLAREARRAAELSGIAPMAGKE